MKKFLASVLAVMMILSLVCFASAESTQEDLAALQQSGCRVYMMVGVVDADGNVATIDGTESEIFLFVADTETKACGFGSYATGDDQTEEPENYAEGTFEATAEEDGTTYDVVCTFSDGSTLTMYYDSTEDTVVYVNAEKQVSCVLMNVVTLAQAVEAETAAQ